MTSEFEPSVHSPPQTESPEPRLRFPLVYLFYGMAVLAISLATFGAWGVVPALMVLATWSAVFFQKARPKSLRDAATVALVCAAVGGFLILPALRATRTPSYRNACINNMRQVAMALDAYHITYGSYPPAYVADPKGKPLHSWRVLILPFLEEESLYNQYDFSEPWNGPHNSLLAEKMPQCYRCYLHEAPESRIANSPGYYAVVGTDAAWAGATATTRGELAKRPFQTLLVVEHNRHDVNWLEPRDLSADEALEYLTNSEATQGNHVQREFFFEYYTGGHALAFTDNHVQYLNGPLERATASAMISRSYGRFMLDDVVMPRDIHGYSRPRYANWFRLGCFVIIVLFPLPWVWIHPHGTRPRSAV